MFAAARKINYAHLFVYFFLSYRCSYILCTFILHNSLKSSWNKMGKRKTMMFREEYVRSEVSTRKEHLLVWKSEISVDTWAAWSQTTDSLTCTERQPGKKKSEMGSLRRCIKRQVKSNSEIVSELDKNAECTVVMGFDWGYSLIGQPTWILQFLLSWRTISRQWEWIIEIVLQFFLLHRRKVYDKSCSAWRKRLHPINLTRAPYYWIDENNALGWLVNLRDISVEVDDVVRFHFRQTRQNKLNDRRGESELNGVTRSQKALPCRCHQIKCKNAPHCFLAACCAPGIYFTWFDSKCRAFLTNNTNVQKYRKNAKNFVPSGWLFCCWICTLILRSRSHTVHVVSHSLTTHFS